MQDRGVRVGTWNLEGRWSQDHRELLVAQECEVWLLTEVRDDTSLPGFGFHHGQFVWAGGRGKYVWQYECGRAG